MTGEAAHYRIWAGSLGIRCRRQAGKDLVNVDEFYAAGIREFVRAGNSESFLRDLTLKP